MAQTNIRGAQILNNTVQRQDMNVATSGQAVITKIVPGTNISLSSTGADAGTGDVTVTAASAFTPSGNVTDYVGGDSATHPLPIALGGKLVLSSATALSFAPFNGGYIKINGQFYPIPSGGITGLTNTSCYIDGAIGNLAAASLYRVYCWNNAGTLTAEFSSTVHATSSTAGNVGTEIKSGNDTRSLIGLVYTNASAQFVDAPTTRYVRSWFNSPRITFAFAGTVNISATTSTITPAQVAVLCWANEGLWATTSWFGTGTTNTNILFSLELDAAVISSNGVTTTSTTGKYENMTLSGAWNVTETVHTVALYANVSAANSAVGNGYLSGAVG